METQFDNNTYKEIVKEEGRQEGIIFNRQENAARLVDVLSDREIAERIGLAEEEVKKIREDIKN